MWSHALLGVASAWALAGCQGFDGWTGPPGPPGAMGRPGDGTVCWDKDNNGACGPREDVDDSGTCDVADCVGGAGPAGPAGPDGQLGAAGLPGASPAGPDGPAGPVGLRGLTGAAGPIGARGPAGAAGQVGPVGTWINMSAQYELDEAVGALAFADTSGLADPLRAEVGGAFAGSATAHSDQSVAFAGTSGLLAAQGNHIADSAEIWPELWIRTGEPARTVTLLEKQGAYKLRLVAGTLEFTVITTGGPCTVATKDLIKPNTWTMVSGWFDGLRVNAALDHSPTSVTCTKGRIATTLGSPLTVGGAFLGDSWAEVFRGNIDEIRIRPIAPFTEPVGGAREQPVWRWTTIHTYCQAQGWWWNNNAGMESLGIAPSSWTDGDAQVDQISSNKDWLRSVLTSKGYGGKDAAVIENNFMYNDSTDGGVTIAMFRIRNTTAQAITWSPQFAITYYASWNERASVALNGENQWNSAGQDCNSWACQQTVSMSIPPGRTSSVLFAATGAEPSGYRSNVLVINHDSAVLPPGLVYVDDFDTMTGDWSE